MAYVGGHGNHCVSVLSVAGDCTERVILKRTAIRNTEIPGLFNFIVGGSHLDKIDEITASQDAVRAFLRDQTSNQNDITFGEVVCYSPYRYVNYASGNSKLRDARDAESIFGWSTNLGREESLLREVGYASFVDIFLYLMYPSRFSACPQPHRRSGETCSKRELKR
jgi:hypothetical protein